MADEDLNLAPVESAINLRLKAVAEKFPKALGRLSLASECKPDGKVFWRVSVPSYHAHADDVSHSDSEFPVACSVAEASLQLALRKLLTLPVREGSECNPNCGKYGAQGGRI